MLLKVMKILKQIKALKPMMSHDVFELSHDEINNKLVDNAS